MLKSKYTDLVIALILGYFAFDRLSDGVYGFGTLFAVLAILNFVTFFVKVKQEKQEQ